MNKLLLRQLNKYFTTEIPTELLSLFKTISDSYDHYEKDRKMLERSIEITSQEMIELNNRLRQEAEAGNKQVFEKLKESLALLNNEEGEEITSDIDFRKLANIADMLKAETAKRRLAEKDREQREKHLKASQQIAHIGSWELDLTHQDINDNPLYWSDESYRIFGYKPGAVKVTNELFFNHVHPEDRRKIQEAVSEALDTNGVYDIEHRVILNDGKEKIVHERAEIIIDEKTGEQLKMVGTMQDVTEKKKANEKLRKANEEIRTLFENMQEVFYSVDMQTYQLLQMSPACEDMYGYSVEDFSKNPNLWFELALDEDKPIILANYAPMEQGQDIIQEYRIRHKNGQVRWIESKLSPTLGKDGKLIRLDGVSSDISKRKEAEIALQQSEHKFRALIENSSDAIMVLNDQSVVEYASDSLYRIMGYNPEEIVGLPSYRHIYPDDLPILKEYVRKVTVEKPERPTAITYRRVKKDGTAIWCEGTARDMRHDPSINGIVVNFRDITERIEAEMALKQSEQKFRALIENSSDVINVINETGENLFISNSVKRVTGFTPEECIENPAFQFIYPEDVPAIQQQLANVVGNPGRTLDFTYRRYKKDGSIIWCEARARSFLHDPAINGIVLNFRDVTERIEAEMALKESEYKFRSLIENASDIITVVNSDLETLYVSNSVFRITGYTPDEVIKARGFEFAHPDDVTMVKQFIADILKSPGETKNVVYRTRKKDGSYFWCERIVTNLLDDPRVKGIISNMRDISERQEYEQALKLSEQKFRALIENSSDIILVVDEQADVKFISNSVRALTGFHPSQIEGRSGFDILHPDAIEEARQHLQHLLQNPGKAILLNFKLKKKDGSYFWCEGTITNLLDESAVKGIVFNIRDITQRYKYEKALKASYEDLKKTNMELDRFVYSVSHDLRAPLSSMLGVVEFAETETIDEDMLEHLSMIKKSVKKLDGFILDILDYSRNARLEVEGEEVHFDELLSEIKDNLKYMEQGEIKVDIRTRLQNGIHFCSDKKRIAIVLNNLVSNAIRYRNTAIPDPFVEVDVKLSEAGASIVVKDNGIGIPRDKQDKVFDMFYRVSNKQTGSGLGLYIVKEVINKLNGNIELESEPGIGTAFKIHIPNLSV